MSTTDLIVVGSGILGLATAFTARERGMSVAVIDRADRPAESSVQNFGHACFTGQGDDMQDLAARSRAGWLRAGAATGLWAAQSGTYVPAMTELEMQVIREFGQHRGPDQVVLLGPDEVAGAVGNPGLAAVGGAYLPLDMRVDPREAAPTLAHRLARDGVRFEWNTQVTDVADGVVSTVRGEYRSDRVVVCPGYQLMSLMPQLAEQSEVRVCTLAMALVERPARIPTGFAMFTGTSLARYDGFAGMPSVHELREELARREPRLVDYVANLMVTDVPGGLLVGDSHAYALSPEPFIDEDVAALLLDRAGAYLGIERPVVRQRWLGRYADSPLQNLLLERPDERTTVAVVTSGIGMTLAFGIAELALDGGSSPA